MKNEGQRRAVGGGRISRSLRPALLAGRGAARWAATYASWGERRRAQREQAMLRTADDVARTMGDMKGVVMKLGQMLSSMSGVLPDAMTAQLAGLQADAPPMSYELVESVFRREFGATPQKLFRSFERTPFAAASIGQVHRARLDDGSDVAVKVQYPGVGEAIAHDLANAGMLINMAGVMASGIDAKPIVEELKAGIAGELDYLREARSQQRFYDEFAGHAFIRVPRVHHELTTSRVLVQEYIDGRPFRTALELSRTERDRIGEIIFRYAFGSIYRHGLFNGDPHPGNYLLLDDGGVAFVDYGCVAEFTPEEIVGFKAVLGALLAGDRDAWRAGVERMGVLQPDAPFSTEELYEHMHWYWEPVLHDELTFTPELARQMVARNTQATGLGGRINRHCNVPGGMVFLTRINFGLAGLLGSLRAHGPWREIVREYVEDAPAATELGRLSAATTARGGAV